MNATLPLKLLALAVLGLASIQANADGGKHGQSKHGSAFDAGLRTKPWLMKGVGNAPFPITTKNPEVQVWYNQGNALLHSFWFEEAERSFRWCHKLEPDNAMVYFGMARSGLNWFSAQSPYGDLSRYKEFLNQAVKRKYTVSERERMYIEAWEEAFLPKDAKTIEVIVRKLSLLCAKYPNDIEAKALLGLFNIAEGSAVANDSLLQEVLKVAPMHPGAHHARIHNWDGFSSEQAINSCEAYGKAAPGTGHSLHMPGHIYSKIGMWHEAAIAMDSSTRVELQYMNQRLALPSETWNYPHNRDYLCYIQEQLGRANDSMRGAKDLINAPKPPEFEESMAFFFQMPLMRALVKFERWDEILDGKTLSKAADPFAGMFQSTLEIIALTKTNRVPEAREKFTQFKVTMEEMMKAASAPPAAAPAPPASNVAPCQNGPMPAALAAPVAPPAGEEMPPMPIPATVKVAEAWLLIAEGKRAEGVTMLKAAAEQERKDREAGNYSNDPPMDPWPVMRLIGDALAEDGDHAEAIRAYNIALKQELNDAWCLAGLAKSWNALGRKDMARDFAGRFLAVWSGADPGLKPMQEVLALGLDAKPHSVTLRPEREYKPSDLDRLGPSNWTPFTAPKLDVLGADGKPVKLEDYRGKNVLLVYYLSDQCVHCMEQLALINEKFNAFSLLDTVVLAVSSDSPEKNRDKATDTFKLTLLSDKNHENARRFASYDDFEDMELHSTILIDREGRVRWKRTGGDPFMKVDYLLAEIGRWGQK